jgi:F-type H+-transporting ATPase subunit b
MNFVVYAALLWAFLRKPAAKFLEGRRQNISRTVEYLETQARNYEEQAKVMRRRLDELAQDRERTLKRYEEDGARERDRIIAEASKAADLIIERTEAAMAMEIKAARRALTEEASALALGLARGLLARTVTVEDRSRLAHEFVEQVVKLPAKN